MKMIDIIKSASANMLQSKLRTFLTVIAIFIGAMTLTLTNGIGAGISDYIDRQVSSIGAKDIMVVRAKNTQESPMSSDTPNKYDPNRTVSSYGAAGFSASVLTQKDIDKIANRSGITKVETMPNVSADYISGENSDKYQIAVTSYLDGTNIDLAAGKLPDNKANDPQLLLPVSYVSVLGFSNSEEAVGKQVKLAVTSATKKQTEIPATISGVQRKTIINGGGANLNRFLINKLYETQSEGLPPAFKDQYSAVVARYDTSMSSGQLADLKNRLSSDGYIGQTIDDQIGIIKSVISGITTVFNIFGIIALIAAGFGVINTLLMSVQERTKEIGLMKSMGMGAGRIFLLFSTEAVLLGFWGSLLGILAAQGIGRVANRIAANGFLKDFDGLNLLSFPWQSLLAIMLVIMGIAFVAGTLPARRASKLNPIDALRYE